MTKLRTPDTVEDALDQAVGLVGAAAVADWIGKSADWVRACSDPNNERQLSMRDALAIDRRLVRAGHVAVFADLAAAIVRLSLPEAPVETPAEPPVPGAIHIVGSAADLLERVQASQADGRVDPRELVGLLGAIERLQKVIPPLRRALLKQARGS